MAQLKTIIGLLIQLEKEMRPSPSYGKITILDETNTVLPLKEIERRALVFALLHAKGVVSNAARQLGLCRNALTNRITHYALWPYVRDVRRKNKERVRSTEKRAKAKVPQQFRIAAE